MSAISNVDRLVVVLRQRLLEQVQQPAANRADLPNETQRQATGFEQLQALAAVDDIEDDQLRRALIQNILSEYFGPELLNEAKFQQVIDRVTDVLKRDPKLSKLLSQVVRDLRRAAR